MPDGNVGILAPHAAGNNDARLIGAVPE
jgi:hypothetical protein